jgi:hypothetical protein
VKNQCTCTEYYHIRSERRLVMRETKRQSPMLRTEHLTSQLSSHYALLNAEAAYKLFTGCMRSGEKVSG